MEDLSDKEIAEITGLRPGTIRVRLHRARLFVRKQLARRLADRAPRRGPKIEPSSEVQPRTRRCKELFAELSDYLDDKLDESLCDELEKHLGDCPPCPAFLSELQRSIQECRAGAAADSPFPTRSGTQAPSAFAL